jgi:hypothetical protein
MSERPADDWPTTSATPATRDADSSLPAEKAATSSLVMLSIQALDDTPWSAGVVPVARETAADTRSRGANSGCSSTE